jgi:V8-like Glu-specific endopeptidase
MNTRRLFASTLVLGAAFTSLGCIAESESDPAFDAEDTAESPAPLVNGTTTTDFAPVVRISWSDSNYTYSCTGTAIADDLLVTASHCVKSGMAEADYIKVSVAHGANASAVGKYSSYFIMSEDIYNNVSDANNNDYYYRDFTFIKFGAGTFSSYYGTTYGGTSLAGATVTKVGFGGDTTKEYATKTISSIGQFDAGDYAVAYTNRNGAYTESGDSGGPLLKWNGTTSAWEVLGVVFGHSSAADYHPMFTSVMESHILAPLRSELPRYCNESFEHTNYSGFSWSLCNTTSLGYGLDGFSDPFIARSHWNHSVWNDEMSSMTLPTANTTLTLYEGTGPSGSSVTFQNHFPFGNGSSVPSLVNEGFNDDVSAYSISSGGSGTTTDWLLEITRHGKCIDTSNTTVAGTNVYQWTCYSENTNQLFRIESVGSSYRIKHTASGLCLGAENGGTSNGTKIELQTCDNSNKQLYTMSSNGSTSSVRDFKMVNVNSGRCVDLDAGSSSNGASIKIWECDSTNANQNFALKKI